MVTITDYTKDLNGIEVSLPPLKIADGWVHVPEIAPDSNKNPEDLTVRGEMTLNRTTAGIFLRARLQYGLGLGRNVQGFIISFEGISKIVPS